jgi:four helix bundle protein
MNARTFRELRAWQAAYTFKLRVYELLESGSLSQDEKLEHQLRDAARSAPSQISEGFGRFDPADFARFVKMARASLMECKNHLQDAVDRRFITSDDDEDYERQIDSALKEIGGLLDYLQSPEAKRNAERIRQKRQKRRERNRKHPNQEQPNQEPRNQEHRNPEHRNPEQRNRQPGTQNREP